MLGDPHSGRLAICATPAPGERAATGSYPPDGQYQPEAKRLLRRQYGSEAVNSLSQCKNHRTIRAYISPLAPVERILPGVLAGKNHTIVDMQDKLVAEAYAEAEITAQPARTSCASRLRSSDAPSPIRVSVRRS